MTPEETAEAFIQGAKWKEAQIKERIQHLREYWQKECPNHPFTPVILSILDIDEIIKD